MSDKDQPQDDAPSSGPLEKGSDDAALEEAFFDEDKAAAIKAELEAEADVEGGYGDDQELDDVEGADELARIMAPKRAVRHPIVATVVICASLFGMYWLWEDFRFFLQSSEPRDLGQASQAVKDGRLQVNTYVTLRGQAVPQTMANGNETSLFGASSKRKIYMFVLRNTDDRVVVRTQRPLVTNPNEPSNREKLRPGIFTGRLRRLDRMSYGAGLRALYLRLSKRSKALRQEHQLTVASVLENAGKSGASLTDIRGERVRIKQDTSLALFVTYPGDYELAVHTEGKEPLKGVVVQAGSGAKECGKPDPKTGLPATGRGGSVYVQLDPKVLSLRKVARTLTYTAGDALPVATPSEAPDNGKDVVIGVPPNTEVYNARARDCAKVCVNAGTDVAGCKKRCSTGRGVQIMPDAKGRILVAVGGRCGGFAGEKHEINLHSKPYKSAKAAEAFAKAFGYPYVLVEDASKRSRKVVNFVVRMPAAEAKRVRKEQPLRSDYGISPRFEVLYAKWRHLKRQGSDLVITRTNRGYPPHYAVKQTKEGKRLVAEPLGATLTLPSARIEKVELSLPLELAKGAFVLEEGVKPSSMWSEPFLPGVPIFYLLMAAFVLLNLLAIRAYFRG